MAEVAVAGQLELQRLGGGGIEASKSPVLAAEPRADLLHQVQRALVLAADEPTLRRDFEQGRAGLGIAADRSRAMDVEREQHARRKLLEARITPQRLDRVAGDVEIPP